MNRHQQHLKDTGWTYWQHLHHSITVGLTLIKIALFGFVHGVIPGFWANKAPVGIYRVFKDMRRLRHTQKLFDADDQRQINEQHKTDRI